MGIISFAMITILGLVPAGLVSFRQAMNNTVESQIVQALTNDLELTSFSNLSAAAGQTYTYDADGNATTNAQAIFYTATVTLQPVNSTSSSFPVNLTNPVDQTSEAQKVEIQITNKTQPAQPHTYSVIIANKNI
jgi:uncharacterized protein (TIGR02598 family)